MVDSLRRTQRDLFLSQSRIASGRSFVSPSEDPVAARRALDLTFALEKQNQFMANTQQHKFREQIVGDGSNARRIAGLDAAPSERLGSMSIREFYASIAGRVAMSTATARDDVLATGSVLGALRAQRESISGVNLDEEAIALVKFERAFQGAARFVRVVGRGSVMPGLHRAESCHYSTHAAPGERPEEAR